MYYLSNTYYFTFEPLSDCFPVSTYLLTFYYYIVLQQLFLPYKRIITAETPKKHCVPTRVITVFLLVVSITDFFYVFPPLLNVLLSLVPTTWELFPATIFAIPFIIDTVST